MHARAARRTTRASCAEAASDCAALASARELGRSPPTWSPRWRACDRLRWRSSSRSARGVPGAGVGDRARRASEFSAEAHGELYAFGAGGELGADARIWIRRQTESAAVRLVHVGDPQAARCRRNLPQLGEADGHE